MDISQKKNMKNFGLFLKPNIHFTSLRNSFIV